MRCIPLLSLAFLLTINALFAQEPETKPAAESKTDWSTFDPAAAIAAAGQPPKDLPFQRLWTSKEGVRLFQGLAISANGQRVLALASNGRCLVYDGESGQVLAKVADDLGLATHTALSPDGSRGAIGLTSAEVVTFDTASGKVLHRHKREGEDARGRSPRVADLRFTADGQHVAWLLTNGRFERADLASGERTGHSFSVPDYESAMRLHALSPDGLVAAIDPHPQQPTLTYLVLPAPGSADEPQTLEREYGDQPPCALALSQNLIAFQTVQGRFKVQTHLHKDLPENERKWSTSTNFLTAARTGGGCLAISADEKWVVAVGRGQAEIRRLDVPAFPSLHRMDVENATQTAIAADVLRVAAVDQDGRLTVLSLAEQPELPEWQLQKTTIALVNDRQVELLDKLSDLMQDDPESFSINPSCPKHDVWVNQMLRYNAWEYSQPSPRTWSLTEWLKAHPDSKLARLLLVQRLVQAGWQARGSGYASTVTAEGAQVFQQKITEAHDEMTKLLAQDRPPPESFMYLFDIAKAEGWSEDECMEHAGRVAELSPQYLMPHLCMVEKLLMRWGGEAHSSALYAAWASDKIGGPAGDALYAQLIARIATYEPRPLLRGGLGIDWDRAYQGCRALQDMPQRRALGVSIELELAEIMGDDERLPRLAQIIDRERTPFLSRTRLTRAGFEKLYRENVDRVAPEEDKKESEAE
jgi:hypothetical protein